MFDKIRILILDFMIKFLALDELGDNVRRVMDQNSKLLAENRGLREGIRKMERCFNVGVDVSPYEGRSWAIIVVKQRDERSHIRFVDLSRRTPQEIKHFMDHFTPDRANKHWDTPIGYIVR